MTTPVRVRLRLLAAALCVAALAARTLLPAAAQSAEEGRLDDTLRAVARVRAEIVDAEDRYTRNAAALRRAEAQVDRLLAAVEAAELAVDRQHQAVAAARLALARVRAQVEARRRVMAERAVALYTQRTPVPLAPLLESGSPRDVLRRSAYTDVVTAADQKVFERLEAVQTAVAGRRAALARQQATLSSVVDAQQRLLAQVQSLRDQRALVAAASSAELLALQGERVSVAADRRLAGLSTGGGRAPSAASRAAGGIPAALPGPPIGSGDWTWPARGPVTSEFGYRWGRLHAGLDIGAPAGAPILAARAGVVTFAAPMSGYGNMVVVDHGGGVVTAYAHQTSILTRVGEQVRAGDRLGTVGSTGNSTGPHLHFEVRVGGEPTDPRGYLP